MKQIVDLSNATISTLDVMDSRVATMEKMKRTAGDRSVLPQFYGCVSPENSALICLGASDERRYYRADTADTQAYEFRCCNDTACLLSDDLCNGDEGCPLGDDEHFCGNQTDLCGESNTEDLTDVEYLLCGIGNIFCTPFSFERTFIYPQLSFHQSTAVKQRST